MKDYYKVLGVSSSASPDEIKRAFKNLAKKFHPDLNKGNKASEDRFKEISEAYDVLDNPESRKNYDMQREAGESFPFRGSGHGGYSSSPFGNEVFSGGMEEILSRLSQGFFGGAGGHSKEWQNRSPFGPFSDVFKNSNRSEAASGSLSVPLKVACKGGEMMISGFSKGPQKISIPPGTKQGSILTINTSEGVLRLKISIETDPPFSLRGDIVEATISINIAQAVLGGKVKIRDPKDSEVIVSVPAGSQPGDVLRLKSLGLAGGDLFIRLNIEIPKALNEAQKRLFIKFSEECDLKH